MIMNINFFWKFQEKETFIGKISFESKIFEMKLKSSLIYKLEWLELHSFRFPIQLSQYFVCTMHLYGFQPPFKYFYEYNI
jgi:hypothetical protein